MNILINLIVGIIMLTITIQVHRHTYDEFGDKIPFPRWLLILMFIDAFIPGFNLMAFTSGTIVWLVFFFTGRIKIKSKYIDSLKSFLNKEI